MNNFGQFQHNLRQHWDKRAVRDIPLGVGARSAKAEILRTSGIYGKATISTLTRHLNLNELENYTIMDFGCGSGRLSKMFAPHVQKLICADISENFLNIAKRNLVNFSNVEYLQIESPPILDFEIDFCFSYASLDYMPTKEVFFATLSEINRVSKQFALQLGANSRDENMNHCGLTGSEDPNDELGYVPSTTELKSILNGDNYLIELLAPESKIRGFDRFIYKLTNQQLILADTFGQQNLNRVYINDEIFKSISSSNLGLLNKIKNLAYKFINIFLYK